MGSSIQGLLRWPSRREGEGLLPQDPHPEASVCRAQLHPQKQKDPFCFPLTQQHLQGFALQRKFDYFSFLLLRLMSIL